MAQRAAPVNVFALQYINVGDPLEVKLECQIPFEVEKMVIKTRLIDDFPTSARTGDFRAIMNIVCVELGQVVGQVNTLAKEYVSEYYFPTPATIRNTLTMQVWAPALTAGPPLLKNAVNLSYFGVELVFYPAKR